MEEQLSNSENNMQGQQNVITQKRKPGRPPRNQSASVQSTTQPQDTVQIQSQLEAIHILESKASDNNSKEIKSENNTENNPTNSPDIQALMTTINSLKQQNEKLTKIVETINITNTKPLVTCSDEDINELYVKYLTNKETALDNVVVAEIDDKVIIPKSYYVIS